MKNLKPFFLALTLLLLSLASCLKEKSDFAKKSDYGEEVSFEIINKKRSEMLQDITVDSIALGQKAVYESSIKIETQSAKTQAIDEFEVIQINEATDNIEEVIIKTTHTDFTKNPPEEKITESVLYREKNQIPSPLENKVMSLFSLEKALKSEKFYNLSIKSSQIDEPQLIIEANKCLHENCKVNIKEMYFDRVLFYSDKTTKKIKFKMGVSNEVPYLAGIYYICQVEEVVLETNNYTVSSCNILRDYSF